jgi:hypothetical protein
VAVFSPGFGLWEPTRRDGQRRGISASCDRGTQRPGASPIAVAARGAASSCSEWATTARRGAPTLSAQSFVTLTSTLAVRSTRWSTTTTRVEFPQSLRITGTDVYDDGRKGRRQVCGRYCVLPCPPLTRLPARYFSVDRARYLSVAQVHEIV